MKFTTIAVSVLLAVCGGMSVAEARYSSRLLRLPRDFYDPAECNIDSQVRTLDTEWQVPLSTLVTYPCSKGYLGNLGANPNLLDDLQDAIDSLGEMSSPPAIGCGSKCDIDNGSVKGAALDPATFHQRSFESILGGRRRYRDAFFYFCNNDEAKGELGAMNKLWDNKKGAATRGVGNPNVNDGAGISACECGIIDIDGTPTEFDYGCSKCIGTVDYAVTKCYDTTEPTH
ncbi:hypothetical protein HOP50_04g33290 [Chloropicon primus]|uniref:Uncharacterized protein n=1 Tax=Chloropicon primus TaxID=1764295 RepID=A0A5B8MJM0_9CHLO|nr:hypothetical protein A3770_04p33260 [Chloropicon primus]UPR00020.1 hypothetical protein HOP50_04g33290 [Chloropicon primus]|eukprot:QDZ20808.1 hypothetical protein A3770_04p33260 [Chloropicon primus]